jgi:tetratricopeptide (TPR) repeat protein
MVDIGTIVSGVGLARSFAELMGLIETLQGKIDRLSQSELAAGLRNLDQACSSKAEAESLIREARSCFNKAIGLESGYRQGIAYLGLSLCHSYLDDHQNSIQAMRELLRLAPRPALSQEWYARNIVDWQGKTLPQKVFTVWPFGSFKLLKEWAVVAARRAKYTPDVIRDLVRPTREELIVGVRGDSDAYSLARIQLLVSSHLRENVEWMEKHGIDFKDMELEVDGAQLKVSPNPAPAADG